MGTNVKLKNVMVVSVRVNMRIKNKKINALQTCFLELVYWNEIFKGGTIKCNEVHVTKHADIDNYYVFSVPPLLIIIVYQKNKKLQFYSFLLVFSKYFLCVYAWWVIQFCTLHHHSSNSCQKYRFSRMQSNFSCSFSLTIFWNLFV